MDPRSDHLQVRDVVEHLNGFGEAIAKDDVVVSHEIDQPGRDRVERRLMGCGDGESVLDSYHVDRTLPLFDEILDSGPRFSRRLIENKLQGRVRRSGVQEAFDRGTKRFGTVDGADVHGQIRQRERQFGTARVWNAHRCTSVSGRKH